MFLFTKPPVEDINRFSCVYATQMFVMPSLVMMSIAATRMYRSLTDFCSSDTYDILNFQLFLRSLSDLTIVWTPNKSPRIGPAVPDSKLILAEPMSPTHLEAAVHPAYEKHPSPPKDEKVPYISGDRSMRLQLNKQDEHSCG
jgi:hypothetical protein